MYLLKTRTFSYIITRQFFLLSNMPSTCKFLPVLYISAAAAAKSLQSCPTLCNLMDGSPPGSPITGILQARTLEWVAVSFSNAWKLKAKVKSLSHVQLLVTPWTAAYQAPPPMGFSRQEYWSGFPLPSPIVYIYIYIIYMLAPWKKSYVKPRQHIKKPRHY